MPDNVLTALPQLQKIVEQLGIVGVLIVAIVWLIWERRRLMIEARACYRARDMSRQIGERYRGALVAAQATVPNIDDIILQFKEEDPTK